MSRDRTAPGEWIDDDDDDAMPTASGGVDGQQAASFSKSKLFTIEAILGEAAEAEQTSKNAVTACSGLLTGPYCRLYCSGARDGPGRDRYVTCRDDEKLLTGRYVTDGCERGLNEKSSVYMTHRESTDEGIIASDYLSSELQSRNPRFDNVANRQTPVSRSDNFRIDAVNNEGGRRLQTAADRIRQSSWKRHRQQQHQHPIVGPRLGHHNHRGKRIRTIFTADQLHRLEAQFERQQYMVGTERYYLATSLRLTEAQVKVWFQNRRIKWRKQSVERQQAKMAVASYNRLVDAADDDDFDDDVVDCCSDSNDVTANSGDVTANWQLENNRTNYSDYVMS